MVRYSTSYRFTADILSAADMIQIGELKKNISALNKISKQKYRVVLRGRKPLQRQVVSIAPSIYRNSEMRERSYDYFGNVVGGLANASQIDVYVYER